ncbi:MAG: M14 family zinc carboxypeptidase [Bryobacteraceae bacterium]
MFRYRSCCPAVAAFVLAACAARAAAPPQAMDEDFARSVKEWTTRPEFLNPLVDHLPKSGAAPSPGEALGAHIGKPKVLHYTAQIYGYLRKLEAKSPRVKLQTIGRTEEGKEILVAFISSEENIRNLEQFRALLVRLGDPRRTPEAEAAALIPKAKPIYHVVGGLHAAETGPPEMLTELAYRLAAEESDLIRGIRENVIVALTLVADPDGRDRVVDWYYRHKADAGGAAQRIPGPPYWGKYVYHDNNRDINFTGFSGAAHLDFHLRWRPTVMHDLHESLPYLYIYSGYSVRDPGLDPILFTEMYWFSNYQKMQMVGYGMPGVWDHGTWDIWWPGYFTSIAAYHNAVMQMYETFGNSGPDTVQRDITPPKSGPGGAPTPWFLAPDYTARDWRRPLPAYREVLWSARNNINYMQTGVLSALGLTAAHPRTVIENFYRKNRNSIAEGAAKAPHAFLLPGDQPDLTRVAFVVNCLRRQGIEVGETTADVTLKEGRFPAGSLLVKLDQPFGRLARILLEPQVYEGDSKKLDDTAWTLGLMAHCRVVPVAGRSVLGLSVRPVGRYAPKGRMPAAGAPFYAVVDHGSVNLATLRYRLGRAPVQVVGRAFTAGETAIPSGSLVVPGEAQAQLKGWVEAMGLTAVALRQRPEVLHDAPLPRLAVYSTWGSTQDVGWVRYGLDQSEAVYDLIYKEQVRQGGLSSKYDVIVIPSQGGRGAKSIVEDIPAAGKPLPYNQTPQFRFLGMYGSSPDIRGGMGEEGVGELRSFVEQGGTLITLGAASELPVAYKWTSGIETARPSAKFRAIGPIVQAQIEAPASPLFYGYSAAAMPVRWASSTLYKVAPTAQAEVLLRFKGTPDALLSGECIGIEETAGRPAIIRAPMGQGQLVMFVTNPMFRHQNVGEYRLLFNAIFAHGIKAR